MIPLIERYVHEHIGHWPVQFKPPLSLRPLIRFSGVYNYVMNCPYSSRVIFWFNGGGKDPLIVTKIMDGGLDLESIMKCVAVQERINKELGTKVFPEIFEVVSLSGTPVLFQEAVEGPSYDIELSRAVHGIEPSLDRVKRVIDRQFSEMGEFFGRLQAIQALDQPRRWGQWAYQLGKDFNHTFGMTPPSLTEAHLEEIRKTIDSVPIYPRPVLVDPHSSNIFPGPIFVDYIHPCLDERMIQQPSVSDVFEFIIAYFRGGLVGAHFTDWLSAMGTAILDKEGQTLLGPSVRKILRASGFDPDETKVIWAWIIVTSLLMMERDLGIYKESPFLLGQKKSEFQEWIDKMIKIQDRISDPRRFDLSSSLPSSIEKRSAEDKKRTELNYARVFSRLGESLYKAGCLDEAELAFLQAHVIDPDLSEVNNNLAVFNWEQGHPEKAIEYMERAVRSNPFDPDAVINCSMMMDEAGKKAKGIEILKRYLEVCEDERVRGALHQLEQKSPPHEAMGVENGSRVF